MAIENNYLLVADAALENRRRTDRIEAATKRIAERQQQLADRGDLADIRARIERLERGL